MQNERSEAFEAPPVLPVAARPDPPRAPSPLAAAADVVLASGFPTQLGLGTLLMAAGVLPFDANGRMSMPYVALLMTADTALLAAFIVWRLRAHGGTASAALLGRRPWRREAWLGVGLVPVAFGGVAALLLVLRAAWPWLHNVDANPFEALLRTPGNAAIFVVLVTITGGLKEELQRAFVLHRFGQFDRAREGLVLYSMMFGAGHIIQGYDVAIVTTLLGVAWGAVFLWRRSAVASSVSHAGFNAAQVLYYAVFGA